MSHSLDSEAVVKQWLSDLRDHTSESLFDDPRYYLYSPQSLLATSQPQSLILGTGQQVLANIESAFTSVQHEILFVTCFWAKSASQLYFAAALKTLSTRALAEGRRIRVRICFSSCSLWQKLTQTSSLSGKNYPPSTWMKKFGLPNPSELQGLHITIRSVFVWPFSVMHSKFVILDREKLFMPSCNVSWEDWLEGCIELRGDIVKHSLLFYNNFWGRDEPLPPLELDSPAVVDRPESHPHPPPDLEHGTIEPGSNDLNAIWKASLSYLPPTSTILLPSPHHRNPSFRPFPIFTAAPPPPPTPLNTFLLTIFNHAKSSIYIQTPNMTSPPVLSALQAAIQRGVNVRIVSNTRMMVAEQLITAGRLTEWALKDLHSKCIIPTSLPRPLQALDPEAPPPPQGKLETFYYHPSPSPPTVSGINTVNSSAMYSPIAVKSHLKLTIVDDEIVVLGSGNMDRASWYTSQELGIAFFSSELAGVVMSGVQKVLENCLNSAHTAS